MQIRPINGIQNINCFAWKRSALKRVPYSLFFPCVCLVLHNRSSLLSPPYAHYIFVHLHIFLFLINIQYTYVCFLFIYNCITSPPVVNNNRDGIVPPWGEDPLVDRPSLLLWLAVSVPEATAEIEWHLYVGELCEFPR